MDNQALAESMTDLYLKIEDYFERKTSERPTMEQTNTIFTECGSMIITDMINKAGGKGSFKSDAKPKSDTKCVGCGNYLTVGEKNYCDDNDKQYRCYKCTHKKD